MYKQYNEALAVTVENAVRRDLGYKLRIGKEGIGVNCYGTFPIDFTTDPNTKIEMELNNVRFEYPINGKIGDYIYANTLKCFGSGIENYLIANYDY